MIHKTELDALERRAHEARISMSDLCKRSGKFPQSWYRAKKRGRAEYKLIDALEATLRAIEAERA